VDKKMNRTLDLIGRDKELFNGDISEYSKDLEGIVSQSQFLVIGGARLIGQAVTKEIFKRSPKRLHVVDINEIVMDFLVERVDNGALF